MAMDTLILNMNPEVLETVLKPYKPWEESKPTLTAITNALYDLLDKPYSKETVKQYYGTLYFAYGRATGGSILMSWWNTVNFSKFDADTPIGLTLNAADSVFTYTFSKELNLPIYGVYNEKSLNERWDKMRTNDVLAGDVKKNIKITNDLLRAQKLVDPSAFLDDKCPIKDRYVVDILDKERTIKELMDLYQFDARPKPKPKEETQFELNPLLKGIFD